MTDVFHEPSIGYEFEDFDPAPGAADADGAVAAHDEPAPDPGDGDGPAEAPASPDGFPPGWLFLAPARPEPAAEAGAGPAAAPGCPLAAVLETAAGVLRSAADAGLVAPDAVHVAVDGCIAWLPTEHLLAWSVMFAQRPTVTTFEGSGYVRLTGRIGGVLWRLHNDHRIPSPERRRLA